MFVRHTGILVTFCAVLTAAGAARWLDIPFVEQQKKAGCGSAAVAMVVQYWAREYPSQVKSPTEFERIDELLPVTSPKGIQGTALKIYLDQHGFRAFIFDGQVVDLQHNFDKGRPVIACIAPRGPKAPLHYVVIAGMGDHTVWMNDPARGKLFEENLDEFKKEWDATGNWALLAVPRLSE
jgi:ABC-type bacteriocin/lantibiotic exporter with double-glycine peptidase domain